MRIDHEELVMRNPAFGACVFWHMAHKHCDFTDGKSLPLPYFMLASGMLFHRTTVEKVRRMQFESGIMKAVSENPEIAAGLQERIEIYRNATFMSLQVGAASGIIRREINEGLPLFAAEGRDLPKPIRENDIMLSDTFSAAKRLGAWFALDDFRTIARQLCIEF